jgi:HlyD family secretion protein
MWDLVARKRTTRHGVVRGRVVRIHPVVDEQVRVELELDTDAPGGATLGTAIDGVIHVSTLKDVVYVARPHSAQSESTLGIFRLEGDGLHAVRRQVEFGLTAFTTVEKSGVQQPAEPVIETRSGLQSGDKVILSAFKDANQVRVQF